MERAIDEYYLRQEEPAKSCLLALRSIIRDADPELTEAWKYRMPFFCLNGKMFCYLWIDKKTHWPYVGFVNGVKMDHPALEQGKRARMKIFSVNPLEDIDQESLVTLVHLARKV